MGYLPETQSIRSRDNPLANASVLPPTNTIFVNPILYELTVDTTGAVADQSSIQDVNIMRLYPPAEYSDSVSTRK
jgi:hypothetical protein